jgi:outer membrane cobalamin receptor
VSRERANSDGLIRPCAIAALLAAWGAGLCAVAAVEARASEASSPTEDVEYYETATVRARPVEETAARVTVIDRERIDELGVATVGELLRYVPGVFVVSSGSRAGVATAQVRGGDPNFTVVLVDGVPLNDATDQFGGAVNLNSLPTEFVERVEVVRGPVSAYYGSIGLAGVVNVITRRGKNESRTELSAALGSESLLEGSVSRFSGGELGSGFVGIGWQEESGRVGDDRFEQLSLLGNFSIRTDEGSIVRLSGRAAAWESDDYADGSGGPILGSGETRSSEHDEIGVAAEWLSRGGHRVRVSVYGHDTDRSSPAIFPVVPPATESTRYLDARLGWDVALGRFSHGTLVVGLEAATERGESDSLLLLPPESGGPVRGDYELSRTTGSAIVDWTASRGRIAYELGARVDAPEDFDAALSPRAAVRIRSPTGRRTLRLSAGRSFKLPSFYTLGSPPALGGNPDLEPETSVGLDAGVEHRSRDERFSAALTLFALRFEDLIDFDFSTFRLVNRSEVSSRGAELDLAWQASTELELRASVTWQDVENRETSGPLRRRPHWSGSGQITWRPGKSCLWMADVTAVSDQLDEQVPAPDRTTVPGYAAFGIAGACDWSPMWSARLRLDNLFDREYEVLVGFPAPGRSVRASVALRLSR